MEYTPEQAAALLKATVKRAMKIWKAPTVGEMVAKLQALPQDMQVYIGSNQIWPAIASPNDKPIDLAAK
jgi:hypothetical protein